MASTGTNKTDRGAIRFLYALKRSPIADADSEYHASLTLRPLAVDFNSGHYRFNQTTAGNDAQQPWLRRTACDGSQVTYIERLGVAALFL